MFYLLLLLLLQCHCFSLGAHPKQGISYSSFHPQFQLSTTHRKYQVMVELN